MKKVVVISGSLRLNSNSEILAKECVKGAKEAGHDVEYLSLKGKNIKFCLGCLNCQKSGKCVINDDVKDILEKVKEADCLVFASPVYYYGLSGLLKTLLDRLNPLYDSDYRFKDIYLIATAAEDEENTFDKAYMCLQGWVDCFDRASLKGLVRGGGINDPDEAFKHIEVMKKAYNLGKGL